MGLAEVADLATHPLCNENVFEFDIKVGDTLALEEKQSHHGMHQYLQFALQRHRQFKVVHVVVEALVLAKFTEDRIAKAVVLVALIKRQEEWAGFVG